MDAAAYRKFRVLSHYVPQLRAELAALGLHEGRDFGLEGDAPATLQFYRPWHITRTETLRGDLNGVLYRVAAVPV